MADVAAFLREEPELYIVYDVNVASVAREVQTALPVREAIGLQTSEKLKTLETVQALCRKLLEAGASRKAFSYIFFRAFRMPEYTFLCADVLKTLPPREFRAGQAELLKTFLIGDAEAYEQALAGVTQDLITRAAQIKADIVAQDPEEHGIRAWLNLGHTFGHAIEHEAQERGEDIHHGEAVAVGILLAARLSERIGLARKGLEKKLKEDFESLGLPTECPYPLESLEAAMALDKKAAEGRVKWILPEAPGRVVIKEMSVKEVMDDLR